MKVTKPFGPLHMTDKAPPTTQLFAPVAIRALLNEVLARHMESRACTVEVTFDLNPNIPQRILAGKAFDVGITNPWYVQNLIDAGQVDAASHTPLGRVPLAVAGQDTQVQSVLTSPDGICKLLQSAHSIAFTADGTSGKTFLGVMQRLGLSEQVSGKLVPMGPGHPEISPVGSLAKGDVDVAIAPLTTIMAAPGVYPLAKFPEELNTDIRMSMFLSSASAKKQHAIDLMRFLSDPARDSDFAARGMERFAFD